MRTGGVATCDRSLSPGWHHLAGVRGDRGVTLFVDGEVVAFGPEDGRGGPFERNPNVPLVLGGGPRAGFEGDLAEVRLWDRALDPGEIRALARH
jgi:hypothetical protein